MYHFKIAAWEEIFTIIYSSTGRTDFARDLGNKLLVYISCCFGGRGYPTGDIDESLVETVRNQVFQCLCNQHSINAEDDEEIYPYLRYPRWKYPRIGGWLLLCNFRFLEGSCDYRILLKFDTKEFLNVLAMAFGDDKFSPQLKQRIVDILILVISQSTTFKVTRFLTIWMLHLFKTPRVIRFHPIFRSPKSDGYLRSSVYKARLRNLVK